MVLAELGLGSVGVLSATRIAVLIQLENEMVKCIGHFYVKVPSGESSRCGSGGKCGKRKQSIFLTEIRYQLCQKPTDGGGKLIHENGTKGDETR